MISALLSLSCSYILLCLYKLNVLQTDRLDQVNHNMMNIILSQVLVYIW